jgi:tetratricopeptide (TPR) repeat protein
MECFDKALKINPNLVEAHLSKATALLICFKQADEAIQCFETAYKISPELDRKWKYCRYWYSRALLVAGQDEEALKQIEIELALRPGDPYLLNQKASIFRKLRKQSRGYEDQALKFFEFRAHAIPKDYPGLAELIEIYTQRGEPDKAWPLIDSNLKCQPFSLQQIAKKAEISIADFQIGFQNARLYQIFRQKFSVEDHCITLHSFGLSPNSAMLIALNHALIAPFGIVARDLRAARDSKTSPDMHMLFTATLNTIARLFPVFGSNWLAKAKPQEQAEQIRLLSIGIIYLTEVVIAETGRHIGFLAGNYGISNELVSKRQNQNWKEISVEIGVKFLEHVTKDWQMVKTV